MGWGTRTKAGDFNVMLCELHDDAAVWEQEHGSQFELVLWIQLRALGPGGLKPK